VPLTQSGNRCLPVSKDLVGFASVRSAQNWAAHMIENNRQLRVSIRNFGDFVELNMVQPAIKGQTLALYRSNTLIDPGIKQQPR